MCTHAGRRTMTSFLSVTKASFLNTLSLVSHFLRISLRGFRGVIEGGERGKGG